MKDTILSANDVINILDNSPNDSQYSNSVLFAKLKDGQ